MLGSLVGCWCWLGGTYNSAGLPDLMSVLAIGLGGADLRMRDARMMVDMMIVLSK